MTRFTRMVLLAVVAAAAPLSAWAWDPNYFESTPILFNDPVDCGSPTESACAEMFRYPALSGSTVMYIVPNVTGWDQNGAFKASGFSHEGVGAELIYFTWTDPGALGDPNFAWVRLVTYSGVGEPNPALHLQGKVQFWITNQSSYDSYAKVGLCLGIREIGTNVGQMEDGGTSGAIEWVGVSTKVNAIAVGPDRIVQTTANPASDDVQIYPVGYDFNISDPNIDIATAVIGPGPDGKIDTLKSGDDWYRFGFDIDPIAKVRRPIPAVTLPMQGSAALMEFDLATGRVKYNGSYQDPNDKGGIAAFTGDGVLSAPYNRGVLEHLAFTKDKDADLGGLAQALYLDELKFEAPVPDPTLPPSVATPLVNNDTAVTVDNLMYWCRAVEWARNDPNVVAGTWTNPDPNSADPTQHPAFHTFTSVSPALSTGQLIYARQQNHQDGSWSAWSAPVTVWASPPPYTFSALVDGGGSAGCSQVGWEWVNVTSVVSGTYWYPQGATPLMEDSSQWQTVELDLDDTALMKPGGGGDGILGPSPTGLYTFDSLWFTVGPGADPNDLTHEVYVDGLQAVDPNGTVTTFLDFEDGVNRMQYPRGQSPISPTSSLPSTAGSYDGSYSQRLLWTYASNDPATQSLGMLQRAGYPCGTSATWPDSSRIARIHLLCRTPQVNPTVPLPSIVGPIISPQTAVRVNVDVTATQVDLYQNGAFVTSKPISAVTYADFTGLTLAVGDSISAKQWIGGVSSDFAYPRGVSAAPAAPVIQTPLLPAKTTVTVNNCLTAAYATASQVRVYIAGDPNTYSAAGGTATVIVPVLTSGLQPLQVVTAKQVVNGVLSPASAPATVLTLTPDFYKAPAAGETTVRVLAIDPNATQVKVIVNDPNTGTTTYTAIPGGATTYDMPITGRSGLNKGATLTCRQTVYGYESADSGAQTVTRNTVLTTLVCDNFDSYPPDPNDPNWVAAWPTSTLTYPRMSPSTARNATPGGTTSISTGSDRRAVYKTLTSTTPTATDPVIWNVNIYDSNGPTTAITANVYARLNGDEGTVAYTLRAVGISNLAPEAGNIHYQMRIYSGQNWVDLRYYEAPLRTIGWHTFTVVDKGTQVDAYVDGRLSFRSTAVTARPFYTAYLGCGAGTANSALGYFDDYCVEVGPVRFEARLPNAPVVNSPLQAGDTTVLLSLVESMATNVKVFANGGQIASVDLTPPNASTRNVTVPALSAHQLITAKQTFGGYESDSSPALEVGQGNGPVFLSLGVRNSTSDPNALGSKSTSTAGIDWIGATKAVGGAPIGIPFVPSCNWQTVTFDPNVVLAWTDPNSPIILNDRGPLEHLAITIDANSPNRSSGPYVIYIDNVVNIGAQPDGNDFVLTNFNSYANGLQVLFEYASYSGSTSANLSWPPNTALTDPNFNNPFGDPNSKAYREAWFFIDTLTPRWLRMTTGAANNLPAPIIRLRKPIRMDILMMPFGGCGACCDPNQQCTFITQAACGDLGGTWHAGRVCDPNLCLAPSGACCYSDGSCLVKLQVECSGTWHGEWTSCGPPNPCPQFGACCTPAGACTLTFQAACLSPNIWHGELTTCSPNNCPQPPTGACCAADGSSCTVTTQANCPVYNIWHGEWTSCGPPNPCPQPTGACCSSTGCTVTLQSACNTPSVWMGTGTTCTPSPCTGACCSTSGTCSQMTQAACLAAGGKYYENNKPCRTGNKCPASCRGDMNCDGQVTFADIDLFVAALAGEPAWAHWPCPWINGDCTADGNVTFADIDPFVARIGKPCP